MQYLRKSEYENRKKSARAGTFLFGFLTLLSLLVVWRGGILLGLILYTLVLALWAISYVEYRVTCAKLDLLKDVETPLNEEASTSDARQQELLRRIEQLERVQGKVIKAIPKDMSDEV